MARSCWNPSSTAGSDGIRLSAPARSWSAWRRPRPSKYPSSATSATTTRPCWSRRFSSPGLAAICPRAASSSPTPLSASTTGSEWPRCSAAIRTPSRNCSTVRSPTQPPVREGGPARRDDYRRVVKAKEHIRAGDAFQIVLSQRAERPTSATALELYRSLRRVNPSPYLFLLELDGLALVGSSPETLVKLEGRRASLNPIAGTTAPGAGDAERLLSSEKDRAEHVMLVDLGRNDLSRVCVPGTVRA